MTKDKDITERLDAWAKDAATGRNIMGCDQDLRLAASTIATLRKQLENAREAEREYKRIFAEMTRAKALKGPQ